MRVDALSYDLLSLSTWNSEGYRLTTFLSHHDGLNFVLTGNGAFFIGVPLTAGKFSVELLIRVFVGFGRIEECARFLVVILDALVSSQMIS